MSQQWKRRKMLNMKSKKAEKKELELTDDYKEMIRNNSYLGKKGYTILRSALNEDDSKVLYEELNVKPVVMGAVYIAATADDGAFPVYRENAKKIYIPRFYGIQRYGHPNRSEITEGVDIVILGTTNDVHTIG